MLFYVANYWFSDSYCIKICFLYVRLKILFFNVTRWLSSTYAPKRGEGEGCSVCERIWCKRSFPKNKKFEIENLKKKKIKRGKNAFWRFGKKLKDLFFVFLFCCLCVIGLRIIAFILFLSAWNTFLV